MKRKYGLLSTILLLTFCIGIFSGFKKNEKLSGKSEKVRTVITTDGEVDDMNSVIRFMYYSNEMDLSGIVLTSSVYHYAGDEKNGKLAGTGA
mgnify:CR=1 FL=1